MSGNRKGTTMNNKCGRNCEQCQEMNHGYCKKSEIGNVSPCLTCNITECCEKHSAYSCKDCPERSGCPSVQKIAAEESLLISRAEKIKKAGKVLRVLYWFSLFTVVLTVVLAVLFSYALNIALKNISFTHSSLHTAYVMLSAISVLGYVLLAVYIGEIICYFFLAPYEGFYKGAAVVLLISVAISIVCIFGNIDSNFFSDLTDVGTLVSMVLFWIGTGRLTASVFPELSSRWKNMWKKWLVPIIILVAAIFIIGLSVIMPLLALPAYLGLLTGIIWATVVYIQYLRLLRITGRCLSRLTFETSWFFSK